MRSVCFVERLLLNYSGSLFPEAVRLADVDGDGLNELLVGDTSGKLNIYKHDGTKPFYSCSSLGMITCVGVGDVCNKGKDIIVCLSGEGWCYLFELPMIPGRAEVPGPAEGHTEKDTGNVMKPCFNQHTPANSKAILIGDVDGDGLCELVIGYTDNVVRAFRWQGNASKTSEEQFVQVAKWILDGQVSNLTLNGRSSGPPELMASQPGCTYTTLLFQPAPGQVGPATRDCDESSFSQIYDILLHQTSCRSKVDSCILGNVTAGASFSQSSAPGMIALCSLDGSRTCVPEPPLHSLPGPVHHLMDRTTCGQAPLYGPHVFVAKHHTDGPHVLGPGPCAGTGHDGQRKVCWWTTKATRTGQHQETSASRAGADKKGSLKLMEQEKQLWSLHVDNQMFAMGKVDITCDGSEEVVACAWDGQTYIIDRQGNVVRFQFDDNVCAFSADSSDPCAVQQLVRDVLYQWPQLCSNTNDKTKTHVG
uniref:KICSTOR complex protein ITFG2 isoform X2 n=1 Tax=Myxine glutinosa TaxID=7769 RepID=UPI00358DF38B